MSVLNKPFVRVYKDFSDECWPIEPKETNERTNEKQNATLYAPKKRHTQTHRRTKQSKNFMLTSEHC